MTKLDDFYHKDFRTIVFIFIVISPMLWPICPLAFFRCSLNSATFREIRTTSFIESMGVACSNSVSYNRVQVLSILVLLLACSQDDHFPVFDCCFLLFLHFFCCSRKMGYVVILLEGPKQSQHPLHSYRINNIV